MASFHRWALFWTGMKGPRTAGGAATRVAKGTCDPHGGHIGSKRRDLRDLSIPPLKLEPAVHGCGLKSSQGRGVECHAPDAFPPYHSDPSSRRENSKSSALIKLRCVASHTIFLSRRCSAASCIGDRALRCYNVDVLIARFHEFEGGWK
jgi:hypothetical protein